MFSEPEIARKVVQMLNTKAICRPRAFDISPLCSRATIHFCYLDHKKMPSGFRGGFYVNL